MAQLIIEICSDCTSACLIDGQEVSANEQIASDLADCTRSGDCEPACLYVLDHVGVEFRIVARNASGEYENRIATAEEKTATARAIYSDSESDFSDERTAETYLVWDAAHNVQEG